MHPPFLVAQTINIRNFSIDEGLSSNSIRDIYTDKFGYKWISTSHGLNKYDGITFETFRYDPQDTLSIRANSLGAISEDKEGNIWVFIDIGGIAKYDRVTRKFHYLNYTSKEPSHRNNFVTCTLFDSKGRSWVGTSTNINLINIEQKKFIIIPVNGEVDVPITGIYEDKKYQIWLATQNAFYKFDESVKQFKEVRNEDGVSIRNGSRFLEDKQGNLWIASPQDGIFTLNADYSSATKRTLPLDTRFSVTNLFQTAESKPIVSIAQSGLYEFTNGEWHKIKLENIPEDQLVFAHSTIHNNQIFISDSKNRFYLFDKNTSVVSKIEAFDYGFISSFTLDKKDKSLWLGSFNAGLFQANEVKNQFETIRADNHSAEGNHPIFNIHQAKNDYIYFTSNHGLSKFNPNDDSNELIIDYSKQESIPIAINTVASLNETELLLASDRGIYEFNLRTKQWLKITSIDDRVSDLTIANGNIWATGGSGLTVYDMTSKKITFFRDIPEAPSPIQGPLTRKLLVDSEGIVWVGTIREGLFRVEKKGNQFFFENFMYTGVRTSGFMSHTVNALYEDASNRLWVGGFSSGLLEFDKKNKRFINYTPKGELPIPNIQAIEEAPDGCIWLSAIDGIYKFVPNTNVFKKFNKQSGLSSNTFFLRSSAKSKNGKLLFGSTDGITSFDPLLITSSNSVAKVVLENIKVFNQRLELPHNPSIIDLKHNQNFLSFDFIALDYNTQDQVVYSYQLDGLTDDWISLGKNGNVSFNNLKSGGYTLKIRASINEGVWSKPTILDFSIDTPFWLKLWFFGLLTFVGFSLLWLARKYRLHQKIGRIKVREEIRQKAAADFHDEMGNKLTRIALFSDVLEKKLNSSSKEIHEYVNKIRYNSRSLNSSMRDFLWALDPKKDTAYDVAVLLKDFGEDLFDRTDISFNVDCIESNLQRYKLDMNWKRNLTMIFKEAMHNTLKHSKATKASLSFSLTDDNMQITFLDNGTGFDEKKKTNGYGLTNMNNRTQQMTGSLLIENLNTGGASVQFTGNLKSFSIT